MLTLGQAIAGIAKATHLKEADRLRFRVAGGRISTTNGTLTATAPFEADFPDTALAVDALALKRVWTDTAKAKIVDGVLVVRDRTSTYKIRILDDLMALPEIKPGGAPLSASGRDAILLAANFAANASPLPWTCGVTVRSRHAVATNRVAAIDIDCDLDTDGDLILPAWAHRSMRPDGAPPTVNADRRGVTLNYPDGLSVHSSPLAEGPPESMFGLVPSAPATMVDMRPLIDARADLQRLPGHTVRMDPVDGTVTVIGEDGVDLIVTEVDLGGHGRPLLMQDAVFRLLLAHATHLSFERAPDRLLFAVETSAGRIANGVIAGMHK